MQTWGILLACFGALYLLMAITGEPEMLVAAFVFGVPGVILIALARPKRKRAKRYKQYMIFISGGDERNIDIIAQMTKVSSEQIMEELPQLVMAGLLYDVQINREKRRIERPATDARKVEQKLKAAHTEGVQRGDAIPRHKTISCPGCSANTVVAFDEVVECKYCTTQLAYNLV